MAKGKIHIGTSGWSYSAWRGLFYPDKTKSGDYLPYYSTVFDTTEVNSSFYRLPGPKMVSNWIDKTPDGFTFSVKVSKFLTHIKRLKEPEEPMERFFSVFEPMKERIGMVLVQLPPTLKFDPDVAEHFFALLKEKYSHYQFALEVRHDTWMDGRSRHLMEQYDMAFVISQSNNLFPYAEIITAKNIYLRFHGPEKLFDSSYSDEMMADYAKKIKKWQKGGHTVWAYFNNTMREAGFTNALTLKKMVGV